MGSSPLGKELINMVKSKVIVGIRGGKLSLNSGKCHCDVFGKGLQAISVMST